MSRVVKTKIKLDSFSHIHRLMAAVSLLAFMVVIVSGMQAQVGITTIVVRATLVMAGISIFSRIIIRALATYEEMHSGKG